MAALSSLSGRWQVEQLRFSGSVGRGFWGAHLHGGLCLLGVVDSVLEMSLGRRGRRRYRLAHKEETPWPGPQTFSCTIQVEKLGTGRRQKATCAVRAV